MLVWKGSHIVGAMAFDQKISRARFAGHEVPSHKITKTPAQIEGIRESGN